MRISTRLAAALVTTCALGQIPVAATPVDKVGKIGDAVIACYSLNHRGEVCGDYGVNDPFFWRPGEFTVLPQGGIAIAYDLNDSTLVVGKYGVSGASGFIWDSETGMATDASMFGADGPAYGVSARYVVGQLAVLLQAYRIDLLGEFYQVLAPLSGFIHSAAYRVNDTGMSCGWSDRHASNQDSTRATRWTGLNAVALPTTGGGDFLKSRAYSINGSGDCVGTEYREVNGSVEWRGIVWPVAGGIVDVGSLNGGRTQLWGNNNLGWSVGSSEVSIGYPRAILWNGTQLLDLNTLLPAGSGWTLKVARAVNDSLVIVGQGEKDGFTQGFILCRGEDSTDSDGDALPDDWEVCGIDSDSDGLTEYFLETSNPAHKDVYLEIDYMAGDQVSPATSPHPIALSSAVQVFESYENDGFQVANPDGMRGISLHIQIDEQLDREQWGLSNTWTLFYNAKSIGTVAERAAGVVDAKKMAYRYAIYSTAAAPAEDGTEAFGNAERGGNDMIIGKARIDGSLIAPNLFGADKYRLESAVLLHELGHSLGLGHGGVDSVRFKPNYYSVMNPLWHSPAFWMATGTHPLKYSTEKYPDLDEASLREDKGVGLTGSFIGPFRFGENGNEGLLGGGNPVDWNGDNFISMSPVNVDVTNYLGLSPSPEQPLAGCNDLKELDFNFRDGPHYSDYSSPALDEMSAAALETVSGYSQVGVSEEADVEVDRLSVRMLRSPIVGESIEIAVLSSGGNLQVGIYDVSGRLRLVYSKVVSPGAKAVSIPAHLGSGVYYAKITVGDTSSIRSFAVIR